MVAARIANLPKGVRSDRVDGQICPSTQSDAAEALSVSVRPSGAKGVRLDPASRGILFPMPRGKLLTEADRTAIRVAIAAGRSAAQIAEQLGRSKQTICNEASKMRLRFARRPKQAAPAAEVPDRAALRHDFPRAAETPEHDPVEARARAVLASKRSALIDRAERCEDPVAAVAALQVLLNNPGDAVAYARVSTMLPTADTVDLAAQISDFGEAARAYMRDRREAFRQPAAGRRCTACGAVGPVREQGPGVGPFPRS